MTTTTFQISYHNGTRFYYGRCVRTRVYALRTRSVQHYGCCENDRKSIDKNAVQEKIPSIEMLFTTGVESTSDSSMRSIPVVPADFSTRISRVPCRARRHGCSVIGPEFSRRQQKRKSRKRPRVAVGRKCRIPWQLKCSCDVVCRHDIPLADDHLVRHNVFTVAEHLTHVTRFVRSLHRSTPNRSFIVDG